MVSRSYVKYRSLVLFDFNVPKVPLKEMLTTKITPFLFLSNEVSTEVLETYRVSRYKVEWSGVP